ncbi:MAG: response regulator transcription factor [Candidatus Izemoplasmatales bacterium]|jgi:two-component system alkaline phosphatase synthesis response regulator PhoP
MALIFSVEDDQNIQNVIRIALANSGYDIELFPDAKTLFERLKSTVPNLFLLDIMLPEMDGIEIIKKLKIHSIWEKVPILVISAKTSELDKVVGLDTGADDYLVKPFGVLELISRVKAILRRVEPENNEPILRAGKMVLDTRERTCVYQGISIYLTAKEFSLLKEFMKNPNKLITRDEIINAVWGYEFMGESRTLDVHIKELRQKLAATGLADEIIETIRGVGYKFRI